MSKQMLVLELCCPQCGALLTDGAKIRLDGDVRETHQKGEILLSAIFGDYAIVTDLHIEEGWICDFSCPKCEAKLVGQQDVTGGEARIRIICPGCMFVGPWTFDEGTAWDLFSHSMEVRGVLHRA